MEKIIDNRTKSITDCKIANVKVLYPACDVAIEMLESKSIKLTADMLKAADVSESIDGFRKSASYIYNAAKKCRIIRESYGLSGADCADTDEMNKTAEAESELRSALGTFFSMFGKRYPRTEKGADRPLYNVTGADLVMVGAESQAALNAVNGDESKVEEEFLGRLMWAVARLLTGKPFMTMTDEEAESIKAEADKAASERATKAAESRKKNAEKRAEQARAEKAKQTEYDNIKAENERLKKNVVDRELFVAAVNAMPLSDDQKRMLIDCAYAVKGSAEAALLRVQVSKLYNTEEKPEVPALANQNPIECESTEVA